MTARSTNLTSLLAPKSVALTGATSNPEDLGSYILRNIIFSGYKGRLFPINDKLSQLYDFDTYTSIRDISEEVDLAILTTPSDRVIDDVYDCTRANVKNICIVSKGFAETGSNGLILQKKITKMANEAGIRVLGPNSLGIISTAAKLNSTISPSIPSVGKAAFISQSGALINALCEYADFYSLGFSEIVGLGNKADIDESDFLEYYSTLRDDGRPSVLGCYLESISDGREFIEVAGRLARNVPLVTLIPSESTKTREYIYAHSGSILQKDEVIDIALTQSGALKVYTQQELYDLMLGFSWQVLPRGNKVAIISNAGGGLILAIEQLYRKGLKLVNFSADVKKMLVNELDWKAQTAGVVDLGGEALSLNYLKALDIVLGDHDVNSVVVILSPQVMTQIEESAEVIGRLAKEHGKTVLVSFMGYEGVEKGMRALSKFFIPAFNSVDRAIYVLSKMYEYFNWKKNGGNVISKFSYQKPLERERSVQILEMIERARLEKKVELTLDQCLKVLKKYDIKIDTVKSVESMKETLVFGKKQGYPVEFYCIKENSKKVAYRADQMKRLFEDHFRNHKENKNHKFSDHLVRKIYENKKKFSISILKDVYYEHRDKGWTVKELEKLSFGYYFEMKIEGGNSMVRPGFTVKGRDGVIEALLPLDRVQIENALGSTRFIHNFGYRSGPKFERLKEDLIVFIRKLIKVPLDFPQILGFEVECVIDGGKIKITDCGIKLDLICS
jgi:acetyltransferase